MTFFWPCEGFGVKDRSRVRLGPPALWLGTWLLLAGCTEDQSLEARVRRAADRATAALIRMGHAEVGSVCEAKLAARTLDDPRLLAWVDAQARGLSQDSFIRCLDPAGAPPAVPSESPRGFARLTWLLASTLLDDRGRAEGALDALLSQELYGYGLTHQLYAIEWARSRGHAQGTIYDQHLERLALALERELVAWPRMSDLFCESLNLLARHHPGFVAPPAWIEALLAAQAEDGSFHDGTAWELHFDGEVTAMTASKSHTTAHAIGALAACIASTRSR